MAFVDDRRVRGLVDYGKVRGAMILKWLREFRRSWRGIVKLEQLPDYGLRLTAPDERVVRLKRALRGFVKSPWAVAIIASLIAVFVASALNS